MTTPIAPPRPARARTRRLVALLALGCGWAALVLAGTEVFARPAAPVSAASEAGPAVPAEELAARCAATPEAVRQYREYHVRVRVRADRVTRVPGRHVTIEHHARHRVVTCRVPWTYRDRVREGGEVTVEAAVQSADDRQVDMGQAILE